ncbi:DUF2293 domain-containing protein [Mycolicibacterium celeriflavum]|uniref:Uncharacterized protein n=1 Tax=Mycolicibacterium celeriflavum TaxID=1249101 RepID=A0A1X0BQ81_MYCCF|nr:DUF2293 domain-containing protein [Mycolicibacterium celeriflavum]MCV7240390.1 DUF2293 domain-containing protein [Mycolicibacterium celeriflavum]ORA45206.1 hypothetical protein BST21_17955 [Mycolicibacterium celeriflavum]BBY44131.1 hypothetical protein MCEL_24260 [Mycolicibacterium celeriflavum]
MANVKTRVARVAEAVLAEQGAVRPVDVLVGVGWLAQPNVERWERGRVPSLDRCVQVDAAKVAEAAAALHDWAQERGLEQRDGDYGDLVFTTDGDPEVERAYRTYWASAAYVDSCAQPRRPREIVVISPHNSWECSSCGEEGDFLLKGRTGTLCLDCADLGHLEFLPAGDAALTRRAKKASRLSAVVVRWSRRRHRYERQGILAEPAAIEQAARECLSDAELRDRRRDRDRIRRAEDDVRFQGGFAAAIREQFPGCPPDRAEAIALHAAARGSGRVGRSAAARALDPDAVRLAVAASVRHLDTDYDDLLMSGVERDTARAQVYDRVEDVLNAWRDGVALLDT